MTCTISLWGLSAASQAAPPCLLILERRLSTPAEPRASQLGQQQVARGAEHLRNCSGDPAQVLLAWAPGLPGRSPHWMPWAPQHPNGKGRYPGGNMVPLRGRRPSGWQKGTQWSECRDAQGRRKCTVYCVAICPPQTLCHLPLLPLKVRVHL